ncbi:extensin-like [Papaver somniferum]|uniref:extensin-like n=1 Tax=Papaver somniferum TaxID=3469 RepID=UPI000E6FDF32|nr:extensin-like [Papaver somniferum]
MGSTLTKQVCEQEIDSLLCKCCCAGTPTPPSPPPSPSSPPTPSSPSPPPPSPTPTPASPPTQSICKAGDIYSELRKFDTSDCQLCEDDCQAECVSMGSTLTKQVCEQQTYSLLCKCCCAGTPSTPSPSPSPPSPPSSLSPSPPSPPPQPPSPSLPSPPSPSPQPPSPSLQSPPPPSPTPTPASPPPQSICKASDIYSELRQFETSDCQLCEDDCQDECVSMGSTLTKQVCEQQTVSLLCKCCCAGTPSPSSPSPSPPSPPTPSSPSPPSPSPQPPSPSLPSPSPPPPPSPTPTPPSPPPQSICKSGDIYSELRQFDTSDCQFCEDDCQAECVSMGTTLTKQVCEKETDSLFCKCCCAGTPSPPSPSPSPPSPPTPSSPSPPSPSPQPPSTSLPSPPPPSPTPTPPSPPPQSICKAGGIYSELRQLDTTDCQLCEDDCHAECVSMGSMLTKQVCEQENDSLLCKCCCAGTPSPPYPPPSPSSPPTPSSPSPPSPSPQPPSPSLPSPPPPSPTPTPPSRPPQSICKAGGIYSELRKFDTTDCQLCEDDCQAECVSMGSTLTKQVCEQETDSLLCKCCCAGTPSPPSPSPSSPSPPTPSSPSPPSPSPQPPSPSLPSPPPLSPTPTPPSPPPQSICKAGDIYSELRQFDTTDCQLCEDDCQAECVSMGCTLTKQVCEQEIDSLLCKCCCAGTLSPPSPPPSPSSPPTPSSPSPPSPSPRPPSPSLPSPPPPLPTPTPPSPPPQSICKAGDIYSELRQFDTSDCQLCEDDCQAEYVSMGIKLTKQVCDQETHSLLCKCCCAGTPPTPSPSPPPPTPSPSPSPSPPSSPPPSPMTPPQSPPSPSPSPPPPPICPEPCCPAEIEIPVPGQEPCRYGILPRAPMPSLPHTPGSLLFAAI